LLAAPAVGAVYVRAVVGVAAQQAVQLVVVEKAGLGLEGGALPVRGFLAGNKTKDMKTSCTLYGLAAHLNTMIGGRITELFYI